MILVTGGCFQGKKEYAVRQFGIRPEDAADGASCPLEAIYEAGMLYHFHEYIRRLMQEGREFSLEELLERNPQIVLVTNELGSGEDRARLLQSGAGGAGSAPGSLRSGDGDQTWVRFC